MSNWQVSLVSLYSYSKTSKTQTLMARLPWMIQTRFWGPTRFFRQLKKTNILEYKRDIFLF